MVCIDLSNYVIANTPQAEQYGVYNAQGRSPRDICGYARVNYSPDCPAWGVLTDLYPTSLYLYHSHDISLATVQYHAYTHWRCFYLRHR